MASCNNMLLISFGLSNLLLHFVPGLPKELQKETPERPAILLPGDSDAQRNPRIVDHILEKTVRKSPGYQPGYRLTALVC